jgi:hypothetical protein
MPKRQKIIYVVPASAAVLRAAGKKYGECAKKVAGSLATGAQPTTDESERLIGFGIASDWTRRAAGLKPIQYEDRLMNISKRSPGVTELIRFNLAWSGMNALFSRKAILDVFPPSAPRSELARFRFLWSHAGTLPAGSSSGLTKLHSILQCNITTRIAGLAIGTSVTTLHSLFYKYTPVEQQGRQTGQIIQSAMSSGVMSALDAPVLIYLMRNWSVHGGLIDSSFRSEGRFKMYIDTVLSMLADAHLAISGTLLSRL